MQKDPDQSIVRTSYAVIYTPSRRRDRFPENCVTLASSAEEAIQKATEQENLHAAQVNGPSRSSEGFRLYYLVHWLT
ncbi:MAG: hypothetical protein N0C81_02930 [Candidatus Thiodiazotropha lotti]|uniref:Uncharacterized protein n=1 Tax=Candidatus Thiodiazotropha lotti TaxID=2792787 RepID=A0A9E4K8D1_9GAMM|nr:hypothetical protein [Candidatus Thiodiazotropha lotti]ODC00948.1 hypothetical protein A3197_00150 [Candidatus Thiodiazotropha endoloripes]MCG7920664.1 hypothetical protein [Candidatus Thiodiazotropha lotti]MCG7929814.1 hypothetical protein [Candidatus Thiodiazotropha lotti]MCG7940650.1 hypothetical protein [Candidatus Thiodiazotropha lotti]